MSWSQSEPLAAHAPAAETAAMAKVYWPRSWKHGLYGMVCLAISFVIGWLSLLDISAWLHGAASPSGRIIVMAGIALVIFAVAILLCASALARLPRLTISPAGVKLELLFGTRWVAWNSLAAFTETLTDVGRSRPIRTATANIIGSEASENVLRRRKFAISDSFQDPLPAIVAELNAYHARVIGTAPARLASVETMQDETKFGLADFQRPWLSYAILAILAAVFIGEQILALGPRSRTLRASVETLLALGASSGRATISVGEWYRLFTAPLLHIDIFHIALNGVALFMAGYSLEWLVGRAWFLAFFVIGALGGSLMSLAVNPAETTSVGASGAIMGLFAAALVSSFRLPPGSKERSQLQIWTARIMIPSLLPLATTGSTVRIDYAAHIGGALACAIVTFVLIKAWPDTSPLPQFRKFAAGVAVAGVILIGVGGAAVAYHYSTYQALGALIPRSDLPRSDGDSRNRAAALATRYPRDPRAHWYLGAASAEAGNYDLAERELRTGLQQAEDLRIYFGSRFANGIRSLLALVLLQEGHRQEAQDTARIACQAPAEAAPSESLRKQLTDNHLCD